MLSRSGAAILFAGIAVVLLALWLRDPIIPYGGDFAGASSNSAASDENTARSRAAAVAGLTAEIRSRHAALVSLATKALDAPETSEEGFRYLRTLPRRDEEGIVLFHGGEAAAWAGQLKAAPRVTGTGTATYVDDFYAVLQVTVEKGPRRAVAVSLVGAEPPPSGLVATLAESVRDELRVESVRFSAPVDTISSALITSSRGTPLFRAEVVLLSPERIRFADSARARARGVVLLALLTVLMIAAGWLERRKLLRRAFTVAVAMVAVAVIPWSTFSNFSRAFNPAFYYSPVLGPFTATAGAHLLFAALGFLLSVAIVRHRRWKIPRSAGAIAALLLVAGGGWLARETARGIALPHWGSTATLWLQWQVPVFLVLFAIWLAALWFARIALGRRPTVKMRTAAMVGVLAGTVATFFVWNITTVQRLQLAMRDVSGLERSDGETALLLARFGGELASYPEPGSRADLLTRYATSALAAAEVQVSLGLWDEGARQFGRLDLAPLRYDVEELARAVALADTAVAPSVVHTLGPAGRQLYLIVRHSAGGYTTVVASPRTRLVSQDPFAGLLGFPLPDRSEPPYVLTLAAVSAGENAQPGVMTWHREGNEWHGDQIIATSVGPARAHVEVDIRAPGTRLVRSTLIVIFDLLVAGVLWALGAMAEGGFFRWLRVRSSRWVRSYRGRLTLALFTFFVVPAVAFAWWSYQRLRGDDREVRELLVRETLHAAAGEDPLSRQPFHYEGETPLFIYERARLIASSDSLFATIAPAGRYLPAGVHMSIAGRGELMATSQQRLSSSRIFWGFRAASAPSLPSYVLAAPARSDEIVLDRRRRDLTMLVLFATAVGALAALWLSGIAARILARDLELSRIEVARAERVLAWGEMARQVAHEIKNPLTPIRLGVQHLRRARSDPRVDFDRVLDDNVTRILSEIDRLDEIARAFSRYGTAPSELPPASPVDVAAILRDVIALEKMGIGGVSWSLSGADSPVRADARPDELREVLLNVFENARLARARTVSVTLESDAERATITVDDDGGGISPSALPRVFEPHFSTRTTGSGLGLAISRRLLESWGGTIDMRSEEGKGARIVISLRARAS